MVMLPPLLVLTIAHCTHKYKAWCLYYVDQYRLKVGGVDKKKIGKKSKTLCDVVDIGVI